MDFEVYCDESRQDLIAKKQSGQYFMIGSLWLPADIREDVKVGITQLRQKYSAWGEIKWSKISSSKKDFYLGLIDLFISYQDKLRLLLLLSQRIQQIIMRLKRLEVHQDGKDNR